jgi:integrase
MNNTRFNFTKRMIEKLQAAGDKRVLYYDVQVPGLAIMVSPAGTKTFYLVRRIRNSRGERGNTEKISLGKFPLLTVENARKEALKRLGEIATGANPAQAIRDAKKELTFAELFGNYVERYARQHTKTWQETVRSFERYFQVWRTRKCSTVKRTEVQNWVNRLAEERGIYTANRSFDTFKAVLRWGLKQELIKLDSDPCFGIVRFKTKPRERFILPGDEYQRFIAALLAEPNEMLRDFFLMCLYTGARKTNIMSMRWSDVNLELQTWLIPDTKNDDAQTITLIGQAVALLSRRQRAAEPEAVWVFPSDSRTGHLMSPKFAWKRLLDRAGITDLRIHDIRRTVGSYMAIQGVSPTIIGKALGHRSQQSTAVYTRLTQDPIRLALENMQSALTNPERLLGIESPSRIRPVRRRRHR